MTLDANKQLMKRYLNAWEAGDLDQLRDMLHDNCVTYNLATMEKRDVAFETDACEMLHQSFDEVQLNVQQMVAEGDKVTVLWTLHSQHTGKFMNIDATNQVVHVPGMEINRIVDGKIIEIWRLSDTMSLMQQLGAV